MSAHPVASFIVFFAAFPFLVPYQSLATQVLIFGLFALGFNLLYGYTGLLSFGHAAYYGLGAYGTGIALAKLKVTSLWLALGIGLAAAVVGGALVGFFCLRRRGIYFAMLTLAFAQMLYFIAFHAADLTGGDDGLRGIPLHPSGCWAGPSRFARRWPSTSSRTCWSCSRSPRSSAFSTRRSVRCCRRSARTATAPWPAATTSTGSSCCRSCSRRCSPGWPARSTRSGSRSCPSTRSTGRPRGRW